ncbi:TRAP transporter small permease [Marinivivus vitaminiproducens]|uniref:TRAP transporter small permease n=1 Tax=Marinivivus vitaminiproducens TaxID=3035935 RepID=UPI0027A57EC1|nr:TRAP transporter small permease subunit [Geminicoccaceae bacterium SCSIO 64248]
MMSVDERYGGERQEGAAFQAFCRFNASIERALALLAGAFLALFTAVVFIDVIYRQVLLKPLMWPSEWSVMAFVWSVMLGAAVAARRQSHFVVVLIPEGEGAFNRGLRIFVAVVSLIFALVVLYFGWHMAMAGSRRFTPMMGYSMLWVFSAFPAAGLAFTLFTFEHLVAAVFGYPERKHSIEDEVSTV